MAGKGLRGQGATAGNTVQGQAREGLVAAVIQKGVVSAVDPDNYMMDVYAFVGKREFRRLPIPSLYAHPFAGEGIHVMPEVGAEVWVAIPSEGDVRPFVLLYQPPTDEFGSMRGARPLLSPGDMVVVGRDGNAVRIRRGGVVEIESSPTCRTIYLPREGRIVTIAEGMTINTLAGSMEWYVGEPDELPNDGRLANFRAKLKADVSHRWSIVDVNVGSDIDSGLGARLDLFESGDVETEGDRALVARVTVSSQMGIEVELADGKTLRVGSIDGNGHEPVILGRTFLEELNGVLGEIVTELGKIQTGITGAGGSYTPVTVKIAALRAKISQSLSDDAHLLSSFTDTE